MVDKRALIAKAYAAFNGRDVESVLALMSGSVSWPKASEGGRVVGKEAIRAYWTRQWAEFDPHVEPLELIDGESGSVEVRVRQIVRSRSGEVLSDGEVWHSYTFEDGLIERMDVQDGGAESENSPSAAFSRH